MKKNKRKIVLIILLFLVALVAFLYFVKFKKYGADTVNQPVIFSITGAGSKEIGSEFDLVLNLDTNANLVSSMELQMTYPANLVSLVSITKSPNWDLEGTLGGLPENSNGKIHRVIGSNTGLNGTYQVYTFKFRADAVGSGSLNTIFAEVSNKDAEVIGSGNLPNASFNVALNTPTVNPIRSFTYKPLYPLSGTQLANMTHVLVNNQESIVNSQNNTWSINLNLPTTGQNNIVIVGKNDLGESSKPLTLSIIRRKMGDANNDGVTSLPDFTLLLNNWGLVQAENPADFNENSGVNVTDFTLLLNNWNP